MIKLNLVWNTIQKFQWDILFFITRLILARICGESLPEYGSTIIKSFLGTVLTTTFRVNTLSKNYLIHLSTKSRGASIFIQDTITYLFHDGISLNPNTN